MGVSHDDVVDLVADWLRGNGFSVLTSPSIPVHGDTMAILLLKDYLIRRKKEGRKVAPPTLFVKPDVFAYWEDHGVTLAIEVSKTSDIKEDANNLRKLSVDGRLIVTLSHWQQGELAGIPIRYYGELNGDVLYTVLTGKKPPIRRKGGAKTAPPESL